MGSDALGHAYVVPLTQVLEQLRRFHDCSVGLATSTWVRPASDDPATLPALQTTPEPSAATKTEEVFDIQAQPYWKLPEPRSDSPKSMGQMAPENKTSYLAFSQDPEKATRALLDKAADIKGGGGEQGTVLQAASPRGHKETAGMVTDKETANPLFTEAEKVGSRAPVNSRLRPNT